jgi:hypothetical protein
VPCWTEYAGYCVAVTATGAALLAVPAEVFSGVLAEASIPTVAAAIAAAGAAVVAGFTYADCMDKANRPDDAAKMRQQMQELQREIDELKQLTHTN